jgi:hypothetical protein
MKEIPLEVQHPEFEQTSYSHDVVLDSVGLQI